MNATFDDCLKCTVCTAACPLTEVSDTYPGPKGAGPDTERYRLKDSSYYDEILAKCLNCKRCETQCPSGLSPAEIIQTARLRYDHRKPRLRDRMLASTDMTGPLAVRFAPLTNTMLRLRPVRAALDMALGIDSHRNMPEYARERFTRWWRRSGQEEIQARFTKRITYFHGCYVEYNNPELGRDLVKVLNALGYGVELLEGERCCGVAKIANGMTDSARKDAAHNLSAIRASVHGHRRPVIATSSTCVLTMRDEYPSLLELDNTDVRDSIDLASRFICRLVESGDVRVAFRRGFRMKAAYHTPCHMARLGWGVYTASLLRMIPGLDLTLLEQECCGISGTYGFKKENYDISQAIGAKLFALIEKASPQVVVTDCETCKWQIEMSTGRQTLNPISVLAQAIDAEATRRLNTAEKH